MIVSGGRGAFGAFHNPISASPVKRTRGFSLADVIIAVLVLGLLAGPLLLTVSRFPRWQQRLSEQGLLEAARSLEDRALAVGVDPFLSPMAGHDLNPAVVTAGSADVEREQRTPRPESATVHAILVRRDANAIAETRPGGAGFHLGAAAPTSSIAAPLAPLPPVYLQVPLLDPADGYLWKAGDLSASSQPDAPWGGTIRATTQPGQIVRLELDSPRRSISAVACAVQRVDAWELSQLVSGRAWVEYAGDEKTGDRVETLADGRRRWITQNEGRNQVVEPSQHVRFSYHMAVGAPVLLHGSATLASGAIEQFDFQAYLDIQEKRIGLHIGWPPEIKRLFGDRWSDNLFGYTCHLRDIPGPVNGDLSGLFTAERAASWSDESQIATTVVGPPGIIPLPGNWILIRVKHTLGQPELVTAPSGSPEGYTLGTFGFAAPSLVAGGPRYGRLSARNGTIVSSGSELDLLILP